MRDYIVGQSTGRSDILKALVKQMPPWAGEALRVKAYPKELKFELLPDFGLKKSLFPFQVNGLLYLWKAPRSILADATGLGKTVQVVALMQWLRWKEKDTSRWLVVVVPSTIYQWQQAFRDFMGLEPVLFVGSPEDRRLLYFSSWQYGVISYQTMLRDWELLMRCGIKNFVFDDAHYLRHHQIKTRAVAMELVKGASRVHCLTATAMQKSPLDLHSLLELLGLGKLFGSEIGFERKYCNVNRFKIVLRDGRSFWKKQVVGLKNKAELQRKLLPFYLLRTHKDVEAQLPKLILQPWVLELSDKQYEIYQRIRHRILSDWEKHELKNILKLGYHGLIQCIEGLELLGMEEDSAKFEAIENFLETLNEDEKVVIYTFYLKGVEFLKRRLEAKYPNQILTIIGATSAKEREEVRKRFMEGEERILIGTDAIELGMNLQRARYMIMVNLILNAQRVIQLVGRLRRLGSPYQTIYVYCLLGRKTIEEALWKRLKYEAAIHDALMGVETSIFPSLSATELAFLIREGDT